MSETFQCPNCGAPLDLDDGSDPVIRCPYCNSGVVVPENLRAHESHAANQPGLPDDLLHSLLQPDTLAKIREIKRLVEAGQMIEAIKQYREVFKTGLKEAKDAIDQLAEGKPIAITYSSYQPSGLFPGESPNPQIEAEIRQLLQGGNKIEAIKRLREAYQAVGLKEAKDAIDQLQETGQFIPPHPAATSVFAGESSYQTSIPTLSGAQVAKATAGVVGGASCFAVALTAFILVVTIVPILFAMASHGGPLEGVWQQINPVAFARQTLSVGEEGSGPGLFDDPRAIAVDSSGNVFVANYSDGRIQKFDSNGNFLMLWNIGSDLYVGNMAVDRAGNVYLVYRGDIWQYDGSDGHLIGQLEVAGSPWTEAMAALVDGGLVVATTSEDFWRYDTDGQIAFKLADNRTVNMGDPEDAEAVAVDGLGNVFILGSSTSSIYKYSPTGKLLTRFGSEGDEPGQFRSPFALAVDGQGRIYVSDIKGIQVFSPDGRYLDHFNVEGVAFGLAFSDQGDLWVTSNKPKLIKYTIVK